MGLFVLDLERPKTRKSLVTAAMANLKLYLEELETGQDFDHLLNFAEHYLAEALTKEKDK